MRLLHIAASTAAALVAAYEPDVAMAASDMALLPRNLSPWGMFLGADIVVKAVMVGLVFASLVSWTIWLAKTIELRQGAARARQDLIELDQCDSLAAAAEKMAAGKDAVALLVRSATAELGRSPNAQIDLLKERVVLRLDRAEQSISRRLGFGIGLVATIGSTAPFVGLFGTVWGIMNAFIGISEARTTNLAVVAPGIAEALLATALGLFAAIPAVIIYNQLVRAIAGYRAILGDASAQVLLIVSRDQDRVPLAMARAAE